ncbi:MAG: TonB-dependent receptor, partial [Pyrinomonadaceae bacterium]
MMKALLKVIFAVVFCSAVFGQTLLTVSGRLTSDGQLVRNQRIQLVSAVETFTTQTDSEGNYSFDNVPDGRYLLAYSDKRASVIVDGGQVTIAELAEIVVVAADAVQPMEQVSKTVHTIAGQEMRDRADFTLLDSLRTIPGLRVQQLGGFGRTASIKSRGLRNQDTALLIDGIRFRDVAAITGDASPFLSDLTLTSVSRVEVLRGAGSSLYGTNAVGGTIDFRTPEARRGTHGQIAGAAGGLGLGRFRGLISHGVESGRFGLGAGVSRTVYTKGIDGNDDAHNTIFQARIDANPFARTNISGRIFFSDADVRLNTSPNTLGVLPPSNAAIIDAQPGLNFTTDVDDPDNRQLSRFFSGQVTVNHALSEQFLFAGYYQGLKTRRNNTNGPLGVGFQPFSGADETDLFEGSVHTLNGSFTFAPNSATRTTFGYEHEREDFGNDHITVNAADNFSVLAKQSSNTVFIQQMAGFREGQLQFAGGLRAQFFSLGSPVFAPVSNPTYANLDLDDPPTAFTADGSVSYYFRSTRTKIRAHVGNGYRVPSLYERFASFYFFGSFSSSGNPDLEPERSLAADV